MNLEEDSKLNVVINFQFVFFGIRIDQSIALQLTKVPRGEDPSAEVPRRGGGRRDLSGKEGERALLLVHASLIYRAYFGPDGYVPLIRLWISG